MADQGLIAAVARQLHRLAAWIERGRIVTLQVPIDDLYRETELVVARLETGETSWDWQKRQVVAHLMKAFPTRATEYGVVIETIHHRAETL